MTSVTLPFTLGAVGWTLAEYCLHRFDGHGGKGDTPFSKEHIRHHAEKDYFSPTEEKLAVALPAIGGIAALGSLVAGPRKGISFALGFASMYASYEILHRRLHTHAPSNAYGKWARKHHFSHHFNSPKSNHGVTSPFWDKVFGTEEKVDVVKVPRRHAMEWLVNEDGEVKSEYTSEYGLKGLKPKNTKVVQSTADVEADLQAVMSGVAPE